MRTIRIRENGGGVGEVPIDVARHMIASGHAVVVTGKLVSGGVVELIEDGTVSDFLAGDYLGVLEVTNVGDEEAPGEGADPAVS